MLDPKTGIISNDSVSFNGQNPWGGWLDHANRRSTLFIQAMKPHASILTNAHVDALWVILKTILADEMTAPPDGTAQPHPPATAQEIADVLYPAGVAFYDAASKLLGSGLIN